ncbi:uncharacterized protein LOC100904461 [Galendromus occidentalis]|uniref:Uncharacterized protein LOC100904461 n=1 Tax=Galendromus occidentalis TaxID=34638 RepID=A0AAJ6VXD8_9ACAR|nr:uncharacterized protein LOC100904461 [Galendromus occidentalis]
MHKASFYSSASGPPPAYATPISSEKEVRAKLLEMSDETLTTPSPPWHSSLLNCVLRPLNLSFSNLVNVNVNVNSNRSARAFRKTEVTKLLLQFGETSREQTDFKCSISKDQDELEVSNFKCV